MKVNTRKKPIKKPLSESDIIQRAGTLYKRGRRFFTEFHIRRAIDKLDDYHHILSLLGFAAIPGETKEDTYVRQGRRDADLHERGLLTYFQSQRYYSSAFLGDVLRSHPKALRALRIKPPKGAIPREAFVSEDWNAVATDLAAKNLRDHALTLPHRCGAGKIILSDAVNHPQHYNSHPSGIECIEIVRHMNFNLGNVVKYLWRADHKEVPIQDLEKAAFYLRDEIATRKAAKDRGEIAAATDTVGQPAKPTFA